MYSPRIFISSITSEMLESFINGKGSREHNKRVISAFYAYLMRKRILSENPLLKVVNPRNRRRHRIPGILTVAQTIRLFQELPESCVAAFALMAFFGVRPSAGNYKRNKRAHTEGGGYWYKNTLNKNSGRDRKNGQLAQYIKSPRNGLELAWSIYAKRGAYFPVFVRNLPKDTEACQRKNTKRRLAPQHGVVWIPRTRNRNYGWNLGTGIRLWSL